MNELNRIFQQPNLAPMAALWEEFCCCIIPPRPLGPGVLPCHFSLKHQTDAASKEQLAIKYVCIAPPPSLFCLSRWVMMLMKLVGVKPDRMGQLEAEWAGWKEGGGGWRRRRRRRGSQLQPSSRTQPTRPPKRPTHRVCNRNAQKG